MSARLAYTGVRPSMDVRGQTMRLNEADAIAVFTDVRSTRPMSLLETWPLAGRGMSVLASGQGRVRRKAGWSWACSSAAEPRQGELKARTTGRRQNVRSGVGEGQGGRTAGRSLGCRARPNAQKDCLEVSARGREPTVR